MPQAPHCALPLPFQREPPTWRRSEPLQAQNGSWSCSWRERISLTSRRPVSFSASENRSSSAASFAHRSTSDRRFPSEDGKKLAPIGKELRAIGRNIAQIVKGINLGYAPQLADSEELFRTVYLTLAQMNATIQTMIVAYGSRLRRGAGLKALADKEPA